VVKRECDNWAARVTRGCRKGLLELCVRRQQPG